MLRLQKVFSYQRKGQVIDVITLVESSKGKIRPVLNWAIGLISRVFVNGLGDQGSIPGRVIPKTQKMVLDAALLYLLRHLGNE